MTDTAGASQSGSFDFRFQFWDASGGGTMQLQDEQLGVPVSGGIYNVTLGAGTVTGPASSFDNLFAGFRNVYLEAHVKTAGGPTYDILSPRTRVVAAPYAVNADKLDGLDATAFAPASGSPNYAPASGSANYVAVTGATMSGTLVLPANGLVVGGAQLSVTGGTVGIGTSAPQDGSLLHVFGNALAFGDDAAAGNKLLLAEVGDLTAEPAIQYNVGSNAWEMRAAGGVFSTIGAGGTVTSVGTGLGLTGGPVTTTGTIDLLLNAAGGLSKTLGAGVNELGIVTGGVTSSHLAAGSVAGGTILDGTIADADIATGAAIAFSKLSGAAATVHSHSGADITSGAVGDAFLSANVTKLGAAIDLGTAEATGLLGVANGGTGASALGANGALVMNGTGTVATSVPGVSPGDVLEWNGTTWAPGVDDVGSGWGLLGNAGTSAAINFLGTTDLVDLVLRTNNAERVRVTSAGDVGIGTTAPNANLHVVSSSGATGYFTSHGAGYYSSLELFSARGTVAAPSAIQAGDLLGRCAFGGYDGTGFLRGAFIWGYATENWSPSARGTQITFDTVPNGGVSTQQRMVIDQNGNVGIGSAAPSQKLDVAGTVKAAAFQGDGSALTGIASGGGWTDGGANVTLATSTDLVGVGAASPAAKLHVDSGGFEIFRAENSGAVALVIANSGNVGVGTTVPATRLHVADSALNGGMVLTSTGGNPAIRLRNAGSGLDKGAFALPTSAGAWASDSAADDLVIRAETGSRILLNANSGGSSTLVVSGANVGIGSTSPAKPLDVVGNIGSSGTVSAVSFVGDGSGLTNLGAASIVTGTLPVARGGTGSTTFPSGGVAFSNGTALVSDSTNLFWSSGSFKLGIGTNAPSSQLANTSSTLQDQSSAGVTSGSGLTWVANGAGYAAGVAQVLNGGTGQGLLVKIANTTGASILTLNSGTGPGTDRVVVTGAGNVGINSSTPGQRLSVGGVIESSSGGFRFPDGSTQATAAAGAASTFQQNGNSFATVASLGTNDAFPLSLETSNVSRVWIDAAGGVGIGTTAPAGALQIAGGQVVIPPGTTAAPSIAFSDSLNSGIYSPAGGWVDIVTSGSSAIRFLSGSIVPMGFIRVNTDGSAAAGAAYTFNSDPTYSGMFRPANNTLAFSTNAAERLRIDPSGNVGIGTTAPASKLGIAGDVRADASGLVPAVFTRQDDSDTLPVVTFFGRERSSATAPGAGFGAEAAFILESFTNAAYATAGGVAVAWETAQADDAASRDAYMAFGTMLDNAKAERMRIDSAGNVGIGTTAPGAKLEVAGDVKSTGKLVFTDANGTTDGNGANDAAGDVTANGAVGRITIGAGDALQATFTVANSGVSANSHVFVMNTGSGAGIQGVTIFAGKFTVLFTAAPGATNTFDFLVIN